MRFRVLPLVIFFAHVACCQAPDAAPSTPAPVMVILDAPEQAFTPPVLVSQTNPDFSHCRFAKPPYAGIVQLEVDKQGLSQHVDLLRKTDDKCADKAVIAVARLYRFTPAQKDGGPVPVEIGLAVEANGVVMAQERPESGDNSKGASSVRPPILIRAVAPEIPMSAVPSSANVKVYLWIGTDGVPSHERVMSSPQSEYDAAALEAVRQYRFWPAMKDGKPVKVDLYIDVHFERRSRQ